MKIVIYPVIVLAFMPIFHASAQEAGQTKASAIKFLELTMPGSKFKFETDSNWRTRAAVRKDIQDSDDECKFKYIVDYPYSEYESTIYGKTNKYWYDAETLNRFINFGRVSEVRRSVSDVIVYYIGGDKSNKFLFSSEQTAIRVAYAMEFLRQQCDAAASTGF